MALRDRHDDGGFSGGTLDRPALQQLNADIEPGLIDLVVVYKIDRLSRALMDFSKLVEIFDRHGVAFVSVTQSFNTTTSMRRPFPENWLGMPRAGSRTQRKPRRSLTMEVGQFCADPGIPVVINAGAADDCAAPANAGLF